MGKIYINDYVKQHDNEAETELPENATIRFEIGNTRLRIKITGDCIEVNKQNDTREGGTITINPSISNLIYIK